MRRSLVRVVRVPCEVSAAAIAEALQEHLARDLAPVIDDLHESGTSAGSVNLVEALCRQAPPRLQTPRPCLRRPRLRPRQLPAAPPRSRDHPVIARRRAEHGTGVGRVRWVVGRTFAWLHHCKRLLVRYDRRHEIHEAFLAIGCCVGCHRRLANSF